MGEGDRRSIARDADTVQVHTAFDEPRFLTLAKCFDVIGAAPKEVKNRREWRQPRGFTRCNCRLGIKVRDPIDNSTLPRKAGPQQHQIREKRRRPRHFYFAFSFSARSVCHHPQQREVGAQRP